MRDAYGYGDRTLGFAALLKFTDQIGLVVTHFSPPARLATSSAGDDRGQAPVLGVAFPARAIPPAPELCSLKRRGVEALEPPVGVLLQPLDVALDCIVREQQETEVIRRGSRPPIRMCCQTGTSERRTSRGSLSGT